MSYNFEGGIAHLHIVTFFVSKQKNEIKFIFRNVFSTKILTKQRSAIN